MRQCEVVVPRGGDIPVFDEGVVEMPVKSFLYLVDIVQFGNTPHTNLFPSLGVGLWLGHGGVSMTVNEETLNSTARGTKSTGTD